MTHSGRSVSPWFLSGAAALLLGAVSVSAVAATAESLDTAAQTTSMLDAPVTQISAGGTHTCALTTAGTVKCWGYNAFGQLGNNSTANSRIAIDVLSLGIGVAAISAGALHTCALTTVGGVKCWGYNDKGQLGDNSTTQRLTPVDVANLGSDVAAISAGAYHTCALTTAGGVKCWGYNGYGELGNNSTTDSPISVNVVNLGSGVAAISAGHSHTCALTTAGAVKCWGNNGIGQLGDNSTTGSGIAINVVSLGSGVAAISAGEFHTCALTTSGAMKCWGYNNAGQLGDNSTTNRLTAVDVVSLGGSVAAISAGRIHTCALTTAGAAKCFGDNGSGQLGNNSSADSPIPVDVVSLGSGVAAIGAGANHTCALTATGAVKCWGLNASGQLGTNSTTSSSKPVNVVSLSSGVAAISAGAHHSCVLTTASGVKCWGLNYYGQLGNNRNSVSQETPVDVVGLSSGVAAISAGAHHTCALTTVGGVKCWGHNGLGQLGNNSITDSPMPINVVGLGSGVAAISSGGSHTCALTTAGGVKCWGLNASGQLGTNSTASSSIPVDVVSLGSDVAAISAGDDHTCALTTAGAVKCWGYNALGQLGNNSSANSPIPVDVASLGSSVAAISAGDDHTCALTTAGEVKCWGYNALGQLGNNSSANSPIPVDVASFGSGVAAISAGANHTCALTAVGAVKCWGYNVLGQLGNNGGANSPTPVDVVSLGSGVAAIGAGANHTCALTAAGAVACWGYNFFGQLGDNSNTDRLTPVTIRSGQSISFVPPATAGSGATITLTASASSGLTPVTFDTWTPGTCAVSGITLTLIGAPGSLCGVRASEPGAAPLPAGGSVASAPQQLRLIQIQITTSLATLDIDDSAPTTQSDAATDGMLLIRYLLGYRDSALVTGAISGVARRNATQIAAHIATNLMRFDVDGDGHILATTDGVMILRRLLGIADAAAITEGVKKSSRSDADVVLAIEALKL